MPYYLTGKSEFLQMGPVYQYLVKALGLRGVQPVAREPHVAQDGYKCGPTQNHKFTENIMRHFCGCVLQCI